MNVVIVVPTYNERENLSQLLPQLLAYKQVQVLVVDDNSPDGTAEVVRKSRSKRVHLLQGEKQGLGVAYRRGMQYALAELDAEVVVEMDADLSHDPTDLKRMFAAIDQGADFVIGSRYVQGGGITGWGPLRYLTSWGGNFVARLVAGLYSVRDCTAGFRAIKRWVLEGVEWSSLSTKGYGFQIRLLYEAQRQGASIVELPVTFRDREVGSSKLGLGDVLEFFATAVQLGWWTYGRLVRFLLVGASGFIVNWGLFAVLFVSGVLVDWVIIALATEASILWNFFWNNRWTFKDRRSQSLAKRITRYHYTALGGLVLTYAVYYALTRPLGVVELFAYPVAIVAATAWNFSLSYLWAWKKKA